MYWTVCDYLQYSTKMFMNHIVIRCLYNNYTFEIFIIYSIYIVLTTVIMNYLKSARNMIFNIIF